jgi:hypothetical protein
MQRVLPAQPLHTTSSSTATYCIGQTPLGELNSEKGSKRRDFENTVSNVAFEIHNFWPHDPETWYGQGEGTLPP